MSQEQNHLQTRTRATGSYAGTADTVREQAEARPERSLITVEVDMPHLSRYGRPTTQTLTYGATFPVALGQIVLCPPTRLNPTWTRGRVVALDSADEYAGRLKYVAPLGRRAKTRKER